MTSDGISDEDWDRVHEAAVDYANRTAEDESASAAPMLTLLDELERKYGRLASILATRADYAIDVHSRVALLEEAFAIAERSDDIKNALLTAESLVSLHINDLLDSVGARRWMMALETYLPTIGEERQMQRYTEFVDGLKRLDEKRDRRLR